MQLKSYLNGLGVESSRRSVVPLVVKNVTCDVANGTAAALPYIFRWDEGGCSVELTGSFNNWSEKISLEKDEDEFLAVVDLPEGQHQYKFLVDGEWRNDPKAPTITNDLGSLNNVVEVMRSDFPQTEVEECQKEPEVQPNSNDFGTLRNVEEFKGPEYEQLADNSMASRGGARPEGTDGSDFSSRTVIADRYLASVKAKSCLKYVIFAHYILHVTTVAVMFLGKQDVQSSDNPTPQSSKPEDAKDPSAVVHDNPFVISPFLMLWLASSVPSGLAYMSLARNRLILIIIYIWGSIFLGFCPLALCLWNLFSVQHDPKNMIFILDKFALPIVEMFICIFGLLVHFIGFMNAKTLRDAWMSKKST